MSDAAEMWEARKPLEGELERALGRHLLLVDQLVRGDLSKVQECVESVHSIYLARSDISLLLKKQAKENPR